MKMKRYGSETADTVIIPGMSQVRGSARDFVYLDYELPGGESTLSLRIQKEHIIRFGGWQLGARTSCNTVLNAEGVCGEHVLLELVGQNDVKLTHLTSGCKDSVFVQGTCLPVGESIRGALPVRFQVGTVKLLLRD